MDDIWRPEPPLTFSLLKDLPPDLCFRVVLPFLDGKALSTLFLAVLTDTSAPEHSHLFRNIQRTGHDRLQEFIHDWLSCIEREKCGKDEVRPSINRAISCIQEIQVDLSNNQGRAAKIDLENMRSLCQNLSHSMILIDFFTYTNMYDSENLRSCTDLDHTINDDDYVRYLEWPVWCGTIQILLWVPRGSFHGFKRVSFDANVVILSPNWNQSNFPAWDAMAMNQEDNEIPNVELVAETYNFLPTPPMGRIVGLCEKDAATLRNVALRLTDQNTVAILSPKQQAMVQNRYIQNIRIVTRSQGIDRLRNMPTLPFSSYVGGNIELDDDPKDLLCCWQFHDSYQDVAVTTARDCLPYFVKILKNRERCMAME